MKVYDILYPSQQLTEQQMLIEINWRSAIAAGTLAASLALGAPSVKADPMLLQQTRVYVGSHLNDWLQKDASGKLVLNPCGDTPIFNVWAAYKDLAARGLDPEFAISFNKEWNEMTNLACDNTKAQLDLSMKDFQTWADKQAAAVTSNYGKR